MIFEVIYISNDNLTVTIDCCWPKNNLDYSQALQKSSQPYSFCVPAGQAINSTSMVDKAIQIYFLLLHEIAPLLSKNIYPDVDLRSSRSPAQSTFE